MKNKHIILSAAACLIVGAAAAQNQIQREVDVTRAYEPSVQNALKLNLMPDMADTTQMRPDFNYEITPRPLSYGFAVNPLTPARIAAVGEPVRFPFYAKVGVGFPMQSVADIRYSKSINDRTAFGIYANHYGRWAKIENDMAVKEKATATDNRAGAFLDYRLDDDLTIHTSLDYDLWSVNRYGYFREGLSAGSFNTSDETMKQFYQDGRFSFAIGNSFKNSDKFNFRVNAAFGMFGDKFKYNQMGWDLGAWVGFRAGMDGTLTIGGEYSGSKGQENLDQYSGYLGRAGLAYHYNYDGFRATIGAYVGLTETKWDQSREKHSETTFLPEVTLEKDLMDGAITPFLDLRGSIIDNSYQALAKRNPYLYSGQFAPNTISYNGRAGIKGTLGNTFKYTVYGGYTLQNDATFWANAYSGYPSSANKASSSFYGNEGNVFTVLSDDLNYFEAGVEMQANIQNAVTLTGGFNYYSYSPDTFDEAWGMPEINAHFGATYNHRNKLYLNAGIEYMGERHMFSNIGSGTVNTIDGQLNLKFGADYFINKQFGVFVQLNNLLNQDIYHFNRYPELGINAMAGIKISF